MMDRVRVILRDAVRSFRDAKDGNTLVVFTLALIPVLGLVGAAVDYSRASSMRAAMQSAADATALAIANNAATQTQDELNSSADTYFRALFTRVDARDLNVSAVYGGTAGSSVLVTATANMNTQIMGVMGFRNIPLLATSMAAWGNTRLRVALVLDNTGSMADSNKIGALKTATSNLLDQLKNSASINGDVYVSIVPFVKDVNLDSGNWSSSWIYWDDAAHSDTKSWDANNGTCSKSGYSPRSSCVAQGTCSVSGFSSSPSSCAAAGTCSVSGSNNQSDCESSGVCSDPSRHSQTNCLNHSGTWTWGVWTSTPGTWTQATWTPSNHNTWTGCVMDRGDPGGPNTGNYDTNVVAPTSTNTATLFAAEQYGSCPQAVMGLNYNWSAMKTLVNNMSANGNTNQGIGLALGWMSLTGGGPFTAPALDANYQYKQIIILLTDGLNTQNRWSSNQTTIDDRMWKQSDNSGTCRNIKDSGVILYTIQVNTGSDPTSALLQNCASDASKFFLLTSANQIVTTFNQIGTNLTKLRVAR